MNIRSVLTWPTISFAACAMVAPLGLLRSASWKPNVKPVARHYRFPVRFLNVKDKAMLDKVQMGEKIQFVVIVDAGKMVVTNIQPGKWCSLTAPPWYGLCAWIADCKRTWLLSSLSAKAL
jgi:hypothetical protein